MTVLGLASAVAGFVKVRYLLDRAVIDNVVFRCHYRVTSAILFLCCILCTANSLIGEPINCINDGAVACHVINTYCWITSTFTLPHQQGKPVGTHVAHPGLGNYVDEDNETHYHSYYQWVPFMLFFQGLHSDYSETAKCYPERSCDLRIMSSFTIGCSKKVADPCSRNLNPPFLDTHNAVLSQQNHHTNMQEKFLLPFTEKPGVLFYVPHWIWKNWEEGKVRLISDGMRGALATTNEDRRARQSRLVQYIIDTLHLHNFYASGYFFCEALNFVNVIGNIVFIDVFLGGAFMTYGTEVLSFSGRNQENRTDPMVVVFPRVTKCTFHKYGASGTIQKHDALCVLALNIINEKIYIFLWFWLIILAVLSGLALLYSLVIVVLPSVRETILKRRFRFGSPNGVTAIVEKMQIGDFLLLYLLGQNMNTIVFAEVLDELSQKLNDYIHNNMPTAPSTLELYPMYPPKEKFPKETEA